MKTYNYHIFLGRKQWILLQIQFFLVYQILNLQFNDQCRIYVAFYPR